MNIFNILLIQPLANGLVLFYRILGGNLGLAIIGFTLFLKFILNPLTAPYMESMKKMKDVAPALEKLKSKYKGDKVGFAKAQADFYKEKGVNPGAGCLPYLLQIVVLIAFFNVFTRTLSNGTDLTANFNKLLYTPLKFQEGEVLNTRFLYTDLTKPDRINFSFLSFAIPGPILILAAVTQLLSAKTQAPIVKVEEKVAKKTKGTTDDMQVAMQKSMTYTFPLITLFIGWNFASGLALYWFMFSLLQFIQQARMQKINPLSWFTKSNMLKSQVK